MTRAPSRAALLPALVAALLAAAWPITAVRLDPLALPAALALAVAGVAILRRPVWGAALVLALAPLSRLAVTIGSVNLPNAPIESVLIGLSGALLAVSFLAPAPPGRDRIVTAALIVFIAASLASALQAIDPGSSLAPLARLVGATMLYFAVTRLCASRRDIVVVTGGLVAGLLIAALHGLAQALSGSGTFDVAVGDEVVPRIAGAFDHPNTYALYVAMLIPLAAAIAATRAFPGRWRLAAAVAGCLGVPALVLSYGRGAIVGLAVAGLLWTLAVAPRRGLALAALLAICAAAVAPTAVVDRFSSADANADLSDRGPVWRAALDMGRERPLLGVGIGNYPKAYLERPPSVTAGDRPLITQGDSDSVPFHAHNVVLTVLAEQGFLGVLVLAALGAAALAGALRGLCSHDALARALGWAAGAAITVWLVDGMVNADLYSATTPPLLALIAVAGRARHAAGERPAAAPPT